MWNAWRAARPLIVLALLLLATLGSAASSVELSGSLDVYEFAQVHMGMPVRLRFYAPARDVAAHAAKTAFARVAALDAMMSDYRVDSEVRKLSASSGAWVSVSPELFAVLSRAVEVARASEGAFEPRAARLTHASLATSGPAMQFVEIDGVRYSHVIDPRTGLGLTNRVTARVIASDGASDGATADALATALTVLEPKDGRRLQSQFPGVLISIDLPVVASGISRTRS